jgi:hypothetical protein
MLFDVRTATYPYANSGVNTVWDQTSTQEWHGTMLNNGLMMDSYNVHKAKADKLHSSANMLWMVIFIN